MPSGTNVRSVTAAFDLYLRSVESGLVELAPTTVVTTRSAVKVMARVEIEPGVLFGDVRLGRLTWQHIEQLYAAMRSNGCSSAYIRRCATVLSRSLDLARKRGLIETNPARDAARPRNARTKPVSPTAPELREVLERVRMSDEVLADAAIILASTGLRRGELLGLKWRDVDERSGELHVAFAISDGGPGIGIVRRSTKRADWRDLPLTDSALEAIRRQKDRVVSLVGHSDEFFVFPSPFQSDQPMRPDDLTERWAKARGASSITLQQLRHFAATAMLDAGESYRTVAELLGNSESTLRLHYDGRTDVGKRKAIAALEGIS